MATQIPPLDNSFCNYVDDTPGGHFEMNAGDQRSGRRFASVPTSRVRLGGCRKRFLGPRSPVTNTINGRQVKLCYRNSSGCEREGTRSRVFVLRERQQECWCGVGELIKTDWNVLSLRGLLLSHYGAVGFRCLRMLEIGRFWLFRDDWRSCLC